MKLKKLLNKYDWKNYIVYYSIYAILFIFVLWGILSFFNILAHNTMGDGTYIYWKYNLIILICNLFGR